MGEMIAESASMNPHSPHIPGPPKSPEPPRQLVEIADALSHPAVSRVGLTTTADGRWALMIRIRPGTPLPLKEVEAICADYPIVYQEEPRDLPVARPAYPALGE
jgi:hypothetical protein